MQPFFIVYSAIQVRNMKQCNTGDQQIVYCNISDQRENKQIKYDIVQDKEDNVEVGFVIMVSICLDVCVCVRARVCLCGWMGFLCERCRGKDSINHRKKNMRK